jgi:hypothetical protein
VVGKSQQSFAKHYGEEDGYEGEEWQRRGIDGCGCPLSPSLYIGGRKEGGVPLGFPLGGGGGHRGNPRWVLALPPLRKLGPQGKGGGCPREGAPPLLVT